MCETYLDPFKTIIYNLRAPVEPVKRMYIFTMQYLQEFVRNHEGRWNETQISWIDLSFVCICG